MRAICAAVSKPVNVLVRFAELVGAGVQRVSVGGGLTWVAANAALEVARAIRERGDFSALTVRSPL